MKKKYDKNKIPQLADDDDLFALFGEGKTAKDPGKKFANLFESTLSGKDLHPVLREKEAGGQAAGRRPAGRTIKKYPAPQRELDLHGLTAAQAETAVNYFIRSACREGLRTVLIITGKGLHSEGRATLPDVAEKKIAALKKKELVLSFRWEKRIKRKSGAIIVYLGGPDNREDKGG